MAKKDFDLAAAISGMVSNLDSGTPEVRMISIADIIPNQENFYVVDKKALKPLMDSIAMDGLHHYPLVMKHPEQEGKWQLIDGERRYTACKELVNEGDARFETIPCTVKDYSSAAFAKLQLILSNSTNRVLSPAEISKQAAETEMLFYQLKEEGHEFPGRMRDLVAAACNVSASKLARLKVIRDKLHRDYQYLFEKNKLPEQTAYALARLPEDFQERIIKILGSNVPNAITIEDIQKKYEAGCRWDAKDLKCPDGKSCGGGDRFLRHDLTAPGWEGKCCGERCCLDCRLADPNGYSSCSRMCSKAEARRKEKKAADQEKSDRERLERSKPYHSKTIENAQRILPLIDAAGLPDDTEIPWRYYGYLETCRVGDVRRWADGNFEGCGNWGNARLDPECLEKPLDACKVLKCSADYLLGLTDDVHGKQRESAIWRSPDNPPIAYMEVVAKFELPGTSEIRKMVAKWDGEDWCFPSGAVIDTKCLGWWPMPREE